MEHFSDILKDLIEEKAISLRKIEQECGIPASQISRYLRNTIPNIKTAIKLADYFDCSLDYLFGLSDNNAHSNFKDCDFSKFLPRYEKALKENNLTHWKFAKEYNISESCIRKWKHGQEPKTLTIYTIAKNLSISIDYLVGRC